ncbi:MAG TPA: ankyrin repeat domain-containing protein [Anaerolineales bacterium]|nr:ankyrin repeat domain-containing protein [Anaerolineales bacterium]
MSNPTPEQIRDFVIAGHFDLEKVKSMLEEQPALLNAAHPWSESDRETALMAAAQTGNRPIAEYLLEKGAPLDICTAVMLNRHAAVMGFLDQDPGLINARGAHGLPLLAFAGFSGNIELTSLLLSLGAKDGSEFALHNAISRGDADLVRWLLENTHPDLEWKNYEQKTALAVAEEQHKDAIAELLRERGGTVS